ncbi:MAG: multicopper oxidase family protein [Burkholderiaceae bacterium]
MTTRRDFIGQSAGIAVASLGSLSTTTLLAASPTPDVKTLTLTASPSSIQVGPDGTQPTQLWCFNGQFPGPEIRVRQGDRLRVRFVNQLPQPSSIHWHGIRLPNNMDGVPGLTQDPVPPGGEFVYEFDCPDAGTFWYHPHFNSAEQLGRGLIGALVVEEQTPPALDHDLTWVLSDLRVDAQGRLNESFSNRHDQAHAGRIGNVVLVNGSITDRFMLPGPSRIRLRLIAATNARLFELKFKDVINASAHLMAIDGHPINPKPLSDTIGLAPGQRVDLLIDLDATGSLSIEDYAYPRNAYKLAEVKGIGTQQSLSTAYKTKIARLPSNPVPPVASASLQAARSVPLIITGGAMSRAMRADGIWQINGHAMTDHRKEDLHHMKPNFKLKVGEVVQLQLDNQTAWFHPMHLHGVVFQQVMADQSLGPYRDTILLSPGQKMTLAMRADIPGLWMIHCHVLEHQHSGLMGYFSVES